MGQSRSTRAACAALLAFAALPLGAAELNWSGYGNAHWMDMSDAPVLTTRDLNDSVIQLREFSMFLDVAVNDSIVISAELEAAQNAGEVGFNYAYVGWKATDWLEVKAGKILVPFLRYNEEKPNFKQNLMSPPFTASILAPVINLDTQQAEGIGWSDVGAIVEGTWAGERGILSATLGWINGLESDDPAALDANTVEFADGTPPGPIRPRNGLLENEADGSDNNNGKALVARALYRAPKFPLTVGVSYYAGDWDAADTNRLSMWGVNMDYQTERFQLKGEWGRADVEQQPGLLPQGALDLPPNRTTGDYETNALWIEAAGKVAVFRHERWLKAVLRYDDADSNDQAAFTPFDRDRWTVGAEWQFNSNARLRYEFQRSEIHDFAAAPGPVADSMGEKPEMHMASVIFWF